MRLDTLYLSVLGLATVTLARNIPRDVLVRQASGCSISNQLPSEFAIRSFAGQSTNGGETLSSFDFGYLETKNNITTHCYFNSTSPNAGPTDRTPRFACENAITQFIYQDQRLTLIQAICPDTNGVASVEAAGAADVELECGSSNTTANAAESCKSKDEEFSGKFSSLNPTPASLDRARGGETA